MPSDLWNNSGEREGSRIRQREKLNSNARVTEPQPIPQGALELGWPFRVVPVEARSQAFAPHLQPALNVGETAH